MSARAAPTVTAGGAAVRLCFSLQLVGSARCPFAADQSERIAFQRKRIDRVVNLVGLVIDPQCFAPNLVNDYNSFVMGVHNYYCMATAASPGIQRLAFEIKIAIKNRL